MTWPEDLSAAAEYCNLEYLLKQVIGVGQKEVLQEVAFFAPYLCLSLGSWVYIS